MLFALLATNTFVRMKEERFVAEKENGIIQKKMKKSRKKKKKKKEKAEKKEGRRRSTQEVQKHAYS